MEEHWKELVHRKRTELAMRLHLSFAHLAADSRVVWPDRMKLNELLTARLPNIPYVTHLYALDADGRQISDSIAATGIVPGYYGFDRHQRPYLREPMPPWGFLLSDAYVSLAGLPSLTALHVVRGDDALLGYLGGDIDLRELRDLPAEPMAHDEPRTWRQIKGDPSIRGTVFLQQRNESPLDRHLNQALAILEALITERGLFQVVIHFSSSRATAWFLDDPYRYRILDHEALADPDVCLLYPHQDWPADAEMEPQAVPALLAAMRELRLADATIYLRSASLNIFNGMVSLTFSCDGTHYLPWREFIDRRSAFWSGLGG